MKSILTKKTIQDVLVIAKDNLEKDGSLLPVIHVNCKGKIVIVGLPLDDLIDRRKLFTGLGIKLRNAVGEIDEALFVSETWYYKADKDEKLDIRPSQHPNKKEAIMLVGRNKSGKKQVLAMQPYIKVKGKYVYLKKDVDADGATGVLDYLFDANVAKLKEVAAGMQTPGVKN